MSQITNSDYMSINQAYGTNNPVTPMSSKEIDDMRKRLFDNISDNAARI